ncbi:hypothetical protein K435DRAFT_790965 [Dendrothele bispora CBS 962.96]|uniref:Uncharacterized protein n=1 Tax=Dendrothele bispora (strain CBS 962.96) TaxID=1314807 RepID=A0A4S8MN95_DENBC|nr:hypothetical protein K435DRAFT_790965 [Dendrothele bispora CBS 962.96]
MIVTEIFFDLVLAGAFLDGGLVARGLMGDIAYSGRSIDTIILTVPLLLTNLVTTALIGYKIWCHRRDIQHNLGATNRSSSKVQKILLLLVECGVFYLGIWVWNKAAIVNTMPEIVALYPLLIILVVTHENAKPENANDMSLSQSIRFASVQAASSEAQNSVEESRADCLAANVDNGSQGERIETEV